MCEGAGWGDGKMVAEGTGLPCCLKGESPWSISDNPKFYGDDGIKYVKIGTFLEKPLG